MLENEPIIGSLPVRGVPEGLLWVGRGFIPCIRRRNFRVPKGPLNVIGLLNQTERSLRDACFRSNGVRALKRPATQTGPFGTEIPEDLDNNKDP